MIQSLFSAEIIQQMEIALKKGKTLQLDYIDKKKQLKIGVINYHKINFKKQQKLIDL